MDHEHRGIYMSRPSHAGRIDLSPLGPPVAWRQPTPRTAATESCDRRLESSEQAESPCSAPSALVAVSTQSMADVSQTNSHTAAENLMAGLRMAAARAVQRGYGQTNIAHASPHPTHNEPGALV